MYKNDPIQEVPFSKIDLNDSFFDSLRSDYDGFDNWFKKKSNFGAQAYVLYKKTGALCAFLYLKDETASDSTINPEFTLHRRLKIGTFKIEAHKTVLGQRFMTIILRKMISENYDFTYVTFLPKQAPLKGLFEKFGFKKWGNKGKELVYYKDLAYTGNVYKDFPRISMKDKSKSLLSVWPKYHTSLFPDSRLNTENNFQREDVSFANTIEKVYLTKMSGVNELSRGDLLVIYRTAEDGKVAYYNSVATSVCTVVEVKTIQDFANFIEFKKYCGKGTIFTDQELSYFYDSKRYPYIVKMLYNFPLEKRIIRKNLLDDVGLPTSHDTYWGYIDLNNEQFEKILRLGDVSENFIID